MKKEVQLEIVKDICNSYVAVVETGLEEYSNDFKCTIAIINFITELRKKGIYEEIDKILIDTFLDRINIEIANYLAR